MRSFRQIFILCLLFNYFSVSAQSQVNKIVIFSENFFIDRVYKSMQGPSDEQNIVFFDSQEPELLWLTSARVDIVEVDNQAPLSSEYLCHSHLKLNPLTFEKSDHNRLFGDTTHQNVKFFTLIQGQTDIQLPKGFGIPVISNEPFVFHSMAINSQDDVSPFQMKIKSTFEFIRDRDLNEELKPLFRVGYKLEVPVAIAASHPHMHDYFDEELKTMRKIRTDRPSKVKNNVNGYYQSEHWQVPPGRHTYRHRLQRGAGLPFDTTIHYIAVHLHPYGQSLEMIDLTTQQTVFKSLAENYPDRAAISTLDHFSGEKGIPVFKDHQYELVCEYNNTTQKDVDAMAVIYLYLHDKNFDKSQMRL